MYLSAVHSGKEKPRSASSEVFLSLSPLNDSYESVLRCGQATCKDNDLQCEPRQLLLFGICILPSASPPFGGKEGTAVLF